MKMPEFTAPLADTSEKSAHEAIRNAPVDLQKSQEVEFQQELSDADKPKIIGCFLRKGDSRDEDAQGGFCI